MTNEGRKCERGQEWQTRVEQCVILFGRIVLDVGFSGRLYFERFYNEY
jgi:hypothetical protein